LTPEDLGDRGLTCKSVAFSRNSAFPSGVRLHPEPLFASASGTGIVIPLYTYPGRTWTDVIAVAEANARVPIIAIINPNNGPGADSDPNYAEGVSNLQAAGVTVLGYVWTRYASRDLSTVRSCIEAYKNWYSVDGVFLDEMSNVPGNEAYYSILDDYARSLGLTLTIGNPGDDIPASYVGILDTIVIYESRGLPSSSHIEGWHLEHAKSNFAIIAYGVKSLDRSALSELSGSLGYIYVTDASLPNPYDTLSPHLASIAAALDENTTDNRRRSMNRVTTRIKGAIKRLESGKS
jgi:Spherulation-specific family 4